MNRDGDEPRPISDALAKLRADFGLPATDALAVLEARWEEVVGPEVARHSRLGALRSGVATIVVDSSPWATQLRFLEPTIVQRAEEVTGDPVVREIRIRVDPGTS